MQHDGDENIALPTPSPVANAFAAAESPSFDELPTARIAISTAQESSSAQRTRLARSSRWRGVQPTHGERSGRRLRMRTRILLIAAVALVALSGIGYGAQAFVNRTPRVEVYVVSNQSLTTHVNGGGLTYPAQALNIVYPVVATIEAVNVQVGQAVQPGQALLKLNSAALTSQLQQALAAYQAAQGYLANLYASGASAALIAQAQSQVTTAKGRYDALNAELNSPTYHDGAVTAPFAGIVTKVNVVPGSTVRANAPLITIQDAHSVIVRVQLPLGERTHVQVGQTAEVDPDATPGASYTGFVSLINPALTKPGSDTFEVWITVDNPGLRLLIGESVYARISVSETLPVIPERAVVHPDANAMVYIYSHGRAHARQVHVGARGQSQIGVSRGLTPGERVILLGHNHLSDNQPVRVTGVQQ